MSWESVMIIFLRMSESVRFCVAVSSSSALSLSLRLRSRMMIRCEMMSRMMAMPITPAIKKNDIFSASAIFNSLCEKAVCACSSRLLIN